MLLVMVGCLKKVETFKNFSFFSFLYDIINIILGLHHGYCCCYKNNYFIDCASNGQQLVRERKPNHNGLKEWNLKIGRKKKTS